MKLAEINQVRNPLAILLQNVYHSNGLLMPRTVQLELVVPKRKLAIQVLLDEVSRVAVRENRIVNCLLWENEALCMRCTNNQTQRDSHSEPESLRLIMR